MDGRESDPLVDTLTGFSPDDEDPILAEWERLREAMLRRGQELAELRAKSDPPPDGSGGAAMPVPQAA